MKVARQAVKAGVVPTFRVDLARREVVGLPGLYFDGTEPPAIAEAARRTIAAEMGVRPDQIAVEAIEDVEASDVMDHMETSMTDDSETRYSKPDEMRDETGERADGRPTESPDVLKAKRDGLPTEPPDEHGEPPATEHDPGGDL